MSKQSAEMPEHKDLRKVPKPLMEKRRRDRINQSLETLRMLLLENTNNEKLKNPKVEKAEILESVVHFLRAEQATGASPFQIPRGKRARMEDHDEDLRSPCKRLSYREGMRTCLMQVSSFIANQSNEFGKEIEKLQKSQSVHLSTAPNKDTQLEDPSQQHMSNSCSPSGCAKTAQRTGLSTSPMTSSPQPVMLCEPVWRPW
ncbi:hypothetical protein DNTS_035744 [Danionella cerebrum]|uniref:BHLH domain-containing protein n=1 Tax=Danionella cerebrum TaxID=2873325 RepID=A0A553Q385_9TELE|nr:hypothetical protein DNTS_035744 [Danionella translucida]